MNKQLKNLFFFVKEKLQLLSVSIQIPADDILKWIGYMEITKEHVLRDVKFELSNLDSSSKVELFIKQYHSIVLSIINAVTNQSVSADLNLPVVIKAFYQQVTSTLQQLLAFSEVQHALIKMDLEVPLNTMQDCKAEIREKVHAVRKLLTEKDNVRLLRTILIPVDDFLEENDPVSYKRLNYFTGLVNDLESLRNNSGIKQQLRELLIRWNVNSEDALLFLRSFYESLLTEAETIQEKIDLLALWKKQTNLVILKPGANYDSSELSVHAFLTKFFQEEEAFYIKSQQLIAESTTVPTSTGANEPSGNSPTTSKFITSMNLSELAGFIKVMIESEVLVNEVVLEPLRAASDIFSTSNKETLKFDSIRTKFYNIDANTGRAVIDICSRLASTARQIFR
ncbi:hypothetical protein [Chitinophaga rhizophila]|uniref:Uncharacterized protein n=1 Tax=Chitinophaga rhizophila TaxID=2866212 RepID=A0ABS7G750_9BACT|nr:hypothetical protein [Chitinophaga rhizophila]MBW8683454.1 hypothetical protein [Chitinophaga rhizophila]